VRGVVIDPSRMVRGVVIDPSRMVRGVVIDPSRMVRGVVIDPSRMVRGVVIDPLRRSRLVAYDDYASLAGYSRGLVVAAPKSPDFGRCSPRMTARSTASRATFRARAQSRGAVTVREGRGEGRGHL
jgi:hypothetical protein